MSPTLTPNTPLLPAWRRLLYQGWFYAWQLTICLLYLPLLLVPFRWWRGLYHFYLVGIILPLRWLLNIKLVVSGLEHVPTTPCLFASKHQSAFETFALPYVLPARLPLVAFVVKWELLQIPLWGWFLAKTGAIGLKRERAASTIKPLLQAATKLLAAGRSLIIFPEGTRMAPGQTRPLKPGVAALASALAVPVVPVLLNTGSCWPAKGLPNRAGTIVIQFLPPLAPTMARATLMAELTTALHTQNAELEITQQPVPLA